MSALVAAASVAVRTAVAEAVRRTEKFDIVTAPSPEAALKIAASRHFDLAVLEVKSGEWFKAASELSASFECGVIVVAKQLQDDLRAVFENRGVAVIERPISEKELTVAVRTVYAANVRIAGLRHANIDLSRRIEDMRLVGRAKLVLMETLGYTEAQAHRYIEKKAMDTRVSVRSVASDILRTYEN